MTDRSVQIPDLYHLPCFHEPFSAISHLSGAVIFVVLGAALLWRGRGNIARLTFLGVFVFACVLQFSLSGVFHMMVRGGTAHHVFERLDHAAIFVLIAGTFTPAHGLLFDGWLRWGSLMLIWVAAVTGITLKTIFFDNLAEWIGLSFYLTFGWCGILSTILLAKRHGFLFVKPLIWGGIIYTCGGIMDLVGWGTILPGVIHSHEVCHVAVLTGAILHLLFIWQFAGGDRQQRPAPRVDDDKSESLGLNLVSVRILN